MELLVWAILQYSTHPGIKVHGDNIGVIKGWWIGWSRNAKTNQVFRRIHKLLENHNTILVTRYINTAQNPADGPSRGIYPSRNLLLPPVELPDNIKPFIVDFDAPLQPAERNTSQSVHAKPILPPTEHHRRHQMNVNADEQPDGPDEMSLHHWGTKQNPLTS